MGTEKRSGIHRAVNVELDNGGLHSFFSPKISKGTGKQWQAV